MLLVYESSGNSGGKPPFLTCSFVEALKRRRAFCLHNRDPRLPLNESTLQQLAKTFPKRGAVAQISARNNQVIGNTPFELFGELERDCLLAFDAKGIDRVNQIHRFVFSKLANEVHARIEIAVDFQHPRAVIQRLGQLRMTHLTTRHNDRAQQICACRICSQTRGSVACARADDESRAELACLRYRGCHASVLEGTGGVGTLMLES